MMIHGIDEIKIGLHNRSIKELWTRYKTYHASFLAYIVRVDDSAVVEKAVHTALKSRGLHITHELFKYHPETREIFKRITRIFDKDDVLEVKYQGSVVRQYHNETTKEMEARILRMALEREAAERRDNYGADKREADKREADKREADKRATEKRATEKREAEKREAEKREAEKRATEKRATEKRATEKREADKRATEKREADKRASEKRATEKEAKRKDVEVERKFRSNELKYTLREFIIDGVSFKSSGRVRIRDLYKLALYHFDADIGYLDFKALCWDIGPDEDGVSCIQRYEIKEYMVSKVFKKVFLNTPEGLGLRGDCSRKAEELLLSTSWRKTASSLGLCDLKVNADLLARTSSRFTDVFV
jgi:hypothetical protein